MNFSVTCKFCGGTIRWELWRLMDHASCQAPRTAEELEREARLQAEAEAGDALAQQRIAEIQRWQRRERGRTYRKILQWKRERSHALF